MSTPTVTVGVGAVIVEVIAIPFRVLDGGGTRRLVVGQHCDGASSQAPLRSRSTLQQVPMQVLPDRADRSGERHTRPAGDESHARRGEPTHIITAGAWLRPVGFVLPTPCTRVRGGTLLAHVSDRLELVSRPERRPPPVRGTYGAFAERMGAVGRTG